MINYWDLGRLGMLGIGMVKESKNYWEQEKIYLGEVCNNTKAMIYQQLGLKIQIE